MKWLVQPTFDEIGFYENGDDSHLTILNRNQILKWACKLDISECTRNATDLYQKWMTDPANDK